MEATYTQMCKFMMHKSVYLNVLITRVSETNDHGTTLNLHSFKAQFLILFSFNWSLITLLVSLR